MGSFLLGVVAGVVGLGALAWLVSTRGAKRNNNSFEGQED